jgi:alkylation response protein AidB-like acyl-CoA dehydrogenase
MAQTPDLRLADYSLSADDDLLIDTFALFFSKECPSERVRAAEPHGYDADLWQGLVKLGIPSMGVPVAAGGDGATLADLVLVAETFGARLAPVPLISQCVSARLLAALPGASAVLDQQMSGRRLVAIAREPARPGERQLVADAAIATDVIALEGEDLTLTTLDSPPPLARNQGSTPLGWWEPGTGQRVVLASGEAARLAIGLAAAEYKLLTSAALVGLTESALGLAVEFAKTRETMGVPIGSLQGVSFPLADIAIGVSGARNLTRRAAWMREHEPGERPELASIAFVSASRVATHGVATAVHTHGGLGFAIEADISLYFLRAKAWSLLAGDPSLELVEVGRSVARAYGA